MNDYAYNQLQTAVIEESIKATNKRVQDMRNKLPTSVWLRRIKLAIFVKIRARSLPLTL